MFYHKYSIYLFNFVEAWLSLATEMVAISAEN